MSFQMPKSVRQIGTAKGKTKIYVEDYVTAFARRMSKSVKDSEVAGVLLGQSINQNREKVVLISGMVSIRSFAQRKGDEFTQEMWTDIYTDIKERFTDLEIVGWFYSGKNQKSMEKLSKIHTKNFMEGEKLLYVYGEMGQVDEFYTWNNGAFSEKTGYFIYYEKNPEMRQYMMEEANREIHIVEQEDDRVLRNIRGVIQEKEAQKQQKDNQWNHGLLAVMLVLAVMLAGFVVRSQSNVADLKNQLSSLQKSIYGERETTVETLGSGVVSGQAVSGDSVAATEIQVETVQVEAEKNRCLKIH